MSSRSQVPGALRPARIQIKHSILRVYSAAQDPIERSTREWLEAEMSKVRQRCARATGALPVRV
jgi:hypothetical protein